MNLISSAILNQVLNSVMSVVWFGIQGVAIMNGWVAFLMTFCTFDLRVVFYGVGQYNLQIVFNNGLLTVATKYHTAWGDFFFFTKSTPGQIKSCELIF